MSQDETLHQKGMTATSEELYANLERAAPSYADGALSNPAIDENHVTMLLKNPRLTCSLIERICNNTRWTKVYRIKVGIVNHPHTPRHHGLNLIKFLFWKDLLSVADNYRLSPPLRRIAEELIKARLDEMALGEKISLARAATRPLIAKLRESREPRIIEALLKNWRTVEEDVVTIANDENVSPEILSIIARDQKWGLQYPVRMAILMNDRTPVHDSLRSLNGLLRKDLEHLRDNKKLRTILKIAATRRLENLR
ncbi:MAG: hypothetical protein AB1756_05170 [Acidobacteriota bacterium]